LSCKKVVPWLYYACPDAGRGGTASASPRWSSEEIRHSAKAEE